MTRLKSPQWAPAQLQDSTRLVATKNRLVCDKLMARPILARFDPDKKFAVLRQKNRLVCGSLKFGGKASPHILHTKSRCDLNLGESHCIVTFFLVSDLIYGTVLIFILIYFE